MSSTGFDVDAWLDEAQPPTRAVKIYGRGDLVAQLQIAQAEHDDRPLVSTLVDERLGGAPPTVAIQLAPGLLAELEASARTFVVRGVLDLEQREAVDAATKVEDDGKTKHVDEALVEVLLLQRVLVDPVLTHQQVTKLRDRIGQAQWDALFRAVSEASQEPIDVPLSRLGSGTGQDS